jgi:hypothetical protein
MKKIIYFLIFNVAFLFITPLWASKNNFQFQLNEYHTQRQSGQTLDMYIRYSLKDEVAYSQYPDYRELRSIAITYLEPTAKFPADTYWEVIAAAIGEDLMARYPLSGVSIQLLVYPNENSNTYEPGFHGPIYTTGDVIPFNQSMNYSSSSNAKV